MTRSEAEQAVTRLAETYLDAREVMGRGNPGEGNLTPQMSRLWRSGDYPRFEDTLRGLRGIKTMKVGWVLVENRRVHAAESWETLGWHVSEWYIRCTRTTTPHHVWVAQPGGKKVKQRNGERREYVIHRHPKAREDKTRLGICLIAELMTVGGRSIRLPDFEKLGEAA